MSESKTRMPAEWEPHERTFMEWPVRESMIHPENYGEVCRGYAQTAKAIAAFEPLTMLVNPGFSEEAAQLCGPEAEILELPHSDAWFRDSGPTFVYESNNRIGINWEFNAWGEKYKPYELDRLAAKRLLEDIRIPCTDVPIILEGGSIHVDGEGTLLTTEQCLLNPNRNPQLSKEEISDVLKKHLGVSEILWLKQGLSGDETDGHVDNVACFAAPGKIILQVCHDTSDPNYAAAQENLELLRNVKDARGRKLEIIEIEQPPERFYNGERLTLSYLNFYLVNGGLILPVFGGDAAESDKKAADILQSAFLGRKIVPVDGMPMIKEGGNVHCITQQMPQAQEGRSV